MITFNNIVERFKIFADAHFFVKSFSFGSPDDVDLSKFTSFPLMHLVYTGATYDAGTKTYNLEVYILDVPADKTKKTDRQKEVVSDAEQCAEDIIADIKNGGNIFLFAQDYEVVNATTTPLEEETKNVLSGVLLDLSVAIPYEWDACNAPIDGVTPEGGDEVAYARRGILRMLTVDGSTDVLSVRTIKVTNGTLTDDGDGVVTLDTGGAESLDDLDDVTITAPLATGQVIVYDRDASPRGFHNQENSLANLTDTNITSTPANAFLRYVDGAWEAVPVTIPSPPPSTTDGLPEGETNLYYTEARVSANTDVAANTAKVGITAQQAADITANNAKVGITPTQASEITANTAKVGITTQQADDITANNAKVSLIAGGTTGQALVKSTGTDYDVEWADIAVDVQYHNRYQSESETLRAGGAETIELYYSAQADGDGLAESASSDTPAAGYDIRRKLYYSEAGFADPDTGTWTQFTAIADNTTFANAKAALLAYLKERTGGTVPISLKMTWEEVAQAPAFTGLLNESYGSGAEAAYSTRRLNGNVTDCMVIRRASDSTTTTIGFDGSGNIDEAAIETFCTGTTCTVVTWKDQSGNGNDATAGSGQEPTIYTGGALVKIDGKVAFTIDGSNDGFNITAITGGQYGIFTVGKPSSLVGYYTDSTTGSRQFILRNGTGYTIAGSFAIYNSGTQTTSLFNNQKELVSFLSNSTTSNYINKLLTRTSDVQSYAGDFSEFIIYNSDKSSDRTSIESNIGDYFTQNTPLLDTYTGAAAAYSLRKLRTAYTGNAVTVRRASDNFTQGIGFNIFGELDTVSLAAFCGASDGFVDTWHDQSGNGNDATQSVLANQPKIYDSVTGVVTENGKPAVQFDGSNDILNSAYALNESANSYEGYFILNADTDTSYNAVLQGGRTHAQISNTNKWTTNIGGANLQSSSAVTGSQFLGGYVWNNSTGNLQIFIDGASVGQTTESADRTGVQMDIGGQSNAGQYLGKMQEIILYASDKSTDRTGIESNINTFYSIY